MASGEYVLPVVFGGIAAFAILGGVAMQWLPKKARMPVAALAIILIAVALMAIAGIFSN